MLLILLSSLHFPCWFTGSWLCCPFQSTVSHTSFSLHKWGALQSREGSEWKRGKTADCHIQPGADSEALNSNMTSSPRTFRLQGVGRVQLDGPRGSRQASTIGSKTGCAVREKEKENTCVVFWEIALVRFSVGLMTYHNPGAFALERTPGLDCVYSLVGFRWEKYGAGWVRCLPFPELTSSLRLRMGDDTWLLWRPSLC